MKRPADVGAARYSARDEAIRRIATTNQASRPPSSPCASAAAVASCSASSGRWRRRRNPSKLLSSQELFEYLLTC